MAHKDCSSMSCSSDEERKRSLDCDNSKTLCDDSMSTETLTAEHSSYMISTPSKSQKAKQNDAFMREPKMGVISRKDLLLEMEEFKFAEMAEAVKDDFLLNDETSPTDSLVSSTSDSNILNLKKCEEKEILLRFKDDFKEKNIDDITPELVDLISPCSPTHASNSLSLSDNGSNFLIDDEIEDQPGLMLNEKNHNNKDSGETYSLMNLTSDNTTTTLRDVSGSLKSLNKISFKQNFYANESPVSKRKSKKTLSRAESLDTLSPCESIASDDMMGDFEINSSLDSIDRLVIATHLNNDLFNAICL